MHDSDQIEDSEYDEAPSGIQLGGVPWIAWVFILLALGDLAWLIVNARLTAAPDLLEYIDYAIKVVPAVVAVLIPAVVLMRQRDAAARASTLFLGTILFALVQGLLILAVPLEPIFETFTPASPETGLVPLSAVYNTLTLLVAAIGLLLMARGLNLARWYEDRSGQWSGILVLAATVFATVVGILSVAQLQLPDPLPLDYLVYLTASVILGIVRMVAWTYLAVTAGRGWLAGEAPTGGWRLATLGSGFIILALILINLAGVFVITDQTFGEIYGWLIYGLYALGHIVLLLAFGVGLPSLDEPDDDGFEDEDEDEDEAFDEDDGFDDELDDEDELPVERRR